MTTPRPIEAQGTSEAIYSKGYEAPKEAFIPDSVVIQQDGGFFQFDHTIESQDFSKCPKTHACMTGPARRYGLGSSHVYWLGGPNIVRYVALAHVKEMAAQGAALFQGYTAEYVDAHAPKKDK